jgi:acetolactate synthase small subunit
VLDYTETPTIQRELLLAKVSILGPEYVEDQLVGGPHHDPRLSQAGDAKFDRESTLAHNFELGGRGSSHPQHDSTSNAATPEQMSAAPAALTPSEALRRKHQHLQSISTLAAQFGAKIVDVSENSAIVEMSAKTSRVDAFLRLLSPFGVLESARSGKGLPLGI